MTMPAQKPHQSKQDVGTPDDFLAAVQARFGKITFDLAAHKANKVCDNYFAPRELSAIYEDGKTDPDQLLIELIEAGGNYYDAKAKIEQAQIKSKEIKKKVKFTVINMDQDHKGFDSLSQDWSQIKVGGNAFLNPEYSDIAPWAEKSSKINDKWILNSILFLIPAATGTNYFAEYIDGKAFVNFLRPRMIFKGHNDPYPKDLILAQFGVKPGYECWRWK